ncbi:RNA polymerase sigma factor [Lysinibacillus sp. 54212]|uniref:RNA polymerase sigma factor n=1 Tax=Lysinibacillus sp. 54212 TaxID=3119829 RepID=UPI002FCB80FF
MRDELLNEAMDLHTEHLLRLSYFYVQSWEVAEDIVQESFMAFYEKAAQYKGEASVKNYLRKIVINRCHDYLRKKKRWQLFLPFKNAKSAEQEVVLSNEKSALLQAVMRLKEKYRETIILYYFEELSTVQIAELLGLNESTVRSRLKRARDELKRYLNDHSEWEVLLHESV